MRRAVWLVAVLLLALAAAGGILYWRAMADPVATEVSPEAAALAEEKLRALREDQEPVELSSVELSSLLRYRAPAWVAGAVGEPSVALSGDTLVLTGKVATERLPSHPDLDALRPMLPDSASVELTGTLRSRGAGEAELEVVEVELAGLPVPARYYPQVLERAGRRAQPGLGPNALAIRLPPGVGTARVQGGVLLLTPQS